MSDVSLVEEAIARQRQDTATIAKVLSEVLGIRLTIDGIYPR